MWRSFNKTCIKSCLFVIVINQLRQVVIVNIHMCELSTLVMCWCYHFLSAQKCLPNLLFNLLYQNSKHKQFPINNYDSLAFPRSPYTHQSNNVNKRSMNRFSKLQIFLFVESRRSIHQAQATQCSLWRSGDAPFMDPWMRGL